MISENKSQLKKAVALHYDRERDNAPRIVASGRGEVAENILALAKEHNIPMHKNVDLVDSLLKYNISTEIPDELYKAVAEVLAFVYSLDEKAKTPQKNK